MDGGRSVHDCGVPNDQSRALDSRVLGLDEAITSPPRRRTVTAWRWCVFGDSASWAETRRGHGRGQQSVLSTPRAGRHSIACSRAVLCLPCPEARKSAETLREVCAYTERIVVVMTDAWSKLGLAFYTLPSSRPVPSRPAFLASIVDLCEACTRKCCSWHALCLIFDCVCVSSTRSGR